MGHLPSGGVALKSLTYPASIVSPAGKTAYLYRLQERLRLEHNEAGAKFWKKQISKQVWDEFLRGWNARSDRVTTEILAQRKKLKADTAWEINLDAAFD